MARQRSTPKPAEPVAAEQEELVEEPEAEALSLEPEVIEEAAPVPAPSRPKVIEVRATINLPRLGFNELAIVDPSVPYIAMCLEEGYIVPTARAVLLSSDLPA